MRNFKRRCKDLVLFTSIVLIYIIVITISGIGCPIQWFTGISCPGCGMSRALFALLRGDFRLAFTFHPLIYVAIPAVLYLFLGKNETDARKKCKTAVLAVSVLLSLLVYGFRIFSHDPLISIDPADGAVVKYFYLFVGGIIK